MSARAVPILLVAVLLIAAPLPAAEPDWFTRVKEQGLKTASEEEVARHERGVIPDTLHAGECYFRVGRHEEGVEVFRKLTRHPDRNYAAAALAKTGEGFFHLGKPTEARAAFERCLEEHPEAWLDESIPDLCRAWLRKLAGEIEAPKPPDPGPDLEALKAEVRELTKRLAELREMIREAAEKD